MAFTYIRPDADDVDGRWTDNTGGTSLFDRIDETVADDNDYIISSPVTAGDVDTARVRLSDPTGATSAPASVRFRYKKTGDDSMALTVVLMEGSTEIARWDEFDIGTGYVTTTETLTTPQFNAISDFTNLYLKFLSEYQWWLDDASIDLDFAHDRYYDSSVLHGAPAHLLLHFDGTDASTTFTDSAGRNTISVGAGTPEIDTAQSKFGGASLLLTSADTDWIKTAHNPDFRFGTTDFTVDFWVRFASVGVGQQPFGMPTMNPGLTLLITASNKAELSADGYGNLITDGTFTFAANTWYHIAVTRNGDNIRVFINGTQDGSTYTTHQDFGSTSNSDCHLRIGTSTGQYLNGWVDEFRVVRGRALWTSAFTPSTVAYDNPEGPLSYLSISRASIGYAKTAAGNLVQFATGTLRITDLGLLVEDASTNLIPRSQEFDNASWAAEVTVTANQATAPDGTVTMDKFDDGTGSGIRHINNMFPATMTSFAAGSTLTFSCFFKDIDRRYVFLTVWQTASLSSSVLDLQTGTFTQAGGINTSGTGTTYVGSTVEAFSNGIYRLSFTYIINSSAVNHYSSICLSNSATPTLTADGDVLYTGSNKSLYAWGAQIEVSTFPTSYIPTTSAAATRASEEITCTGSLFTILTGTTVSDYFDATLSGNASDVFQRRFIGDAVTLGAYPGVNTNTGVGLYNGSASLNGTLGSGGWITGAKVAAGWDGTSASLVGNGGTVATSALVIPGTITDPRLGNQNQHLYAYVRRATFWDSRLADATLQALTTP